MISIVYGHPWGESFNAAIRDAILNKLRADKRDFTLMDLYADNFDPAVSERDLAVYSCGQTRDPLAMKYMDILAKTTEIIFVFPVWWGIEPAIIKGFYDKVLLKDFAWSYSPQGTLSPRLNISKTIVITTSEAPSPVFKAYFEDYLPAHVFSAVGMFNPVWRNLENVAGCGDAKRREFLAMIEKLI